VLSVMPAVASAARVVVPNAQAATEGDSNGFDPFSCLAAGGTSGPWEFQEIVVVAYGLRGCV